MSNTPKNTVYISGPMTGRPGYNYAAFREAAERWRRAGWTVCNPAENFNGRDDLPRQDYMRADVALLPQCSAIALLPGWEESRGARMELLIAQAMQLEVFHAETMGRMIVPTIETALGALQLQPPGEPHIEAGVVIRPAKPTLEPIPAPACKNPWGACAPDSGCPACYPAPAPVPPEQKGHTDFDGAIDGGGYKRSFDDPKKNPLDLLDPEFLLGVGEILRQGAAKYARGNWMRGMSWGGVLAAILRHTLAIANGEDTDPDSGELHVYHLGCEVMFLARFMAHPELYGRFDDRLFKTAEHHKAA